MREQRKSVRYVAEFEGVLKREILPTFGDRVVETITEDEIRTLVASIRTAGKETQANRALVYLGSRPIDFRLLA